VWASAISVLFVALVAATPRSPFHSVLPREFEPGGPFRALSDVVGLGNLGQTGLFLIGIAATTACALAFLMLLRETWHGRLTLRHVLVMAVVFHLVVLMLPLLFSRDAYSYAYIGRIVNDYGGNPYVDTPRDWPLNSLFQLTWPGWRSTPSVYGPLFNWVSVLLTGALKSIPSLITGFQLVAALASLGTTWLVARTVQRVMPERAVFAAAIVGLNPIVVFHAVGGGHNDMLVAFFVALAAAALFSGRNLWAAIALGFAISVKATAAIPLLLLLVAVAAATSPKRRLRDVAVYGGAAAGVWLLLALPFLQTTNLSMGLFDIADNSSWMAPGQLVIQVLEGVGGFLGGDQGADTGTVLARVLVFAASATAITFIAREVWRRPEARTPRALAAAWAWGDARADPSVAGAVHVVPGLDPSAGVGASEGAAARARRAVRLLLRDAGRDGVLAPAGLPRDAQPALRPSDRDRRAVLGRPRPDPASAHRHAPPRRDRPARDRRRARGRAASARAASRASGERRHSPAAAGASRRRGPGPERHGRVPAHGPRSGRGGRAASDDVT
jgi:hypothetical protein